MSEEHLSDETVDELAQEPVKAEGTFPLTPRLVAIAKGEDPDAIVEAPAGETVDEQVEQPAEEVAESDDAPEPEPTSWVTDSDKQRAVSYGLDPEDLSAYSSREEFGRVTRALDKSYSRRQAPQPETQSGRAAELDAKPADAPVDDTKPFDASGKLNLAYYEKNFDEGTVAAVKAIREQQDTQAKYAQEIEAFRQEQDQAAWQTHVNEFHRAAEEIRPDFFGQTVDKSGLPIQLGQSELDRRQKLWDAANVITDHMVRAQERAGLPPSVPPWKHVLKQAEQLAFGDEIAKHEKAAAKVSREAELKKIAAQSKRVRPVATTTSSHNSYRNAPAADQFSTESIMRHPDVEAALRRINERSGTAL
jgi:hypothetical protein